MRLRSEAECVSAAKSSVRDEIPPRVDRVEQAFIQFVDTARKQTTLNGTGAMRSK